MTRRDRDRAAPGGPPIDSPQGELDLDAATREHYEDALLYEREYRRRRADVNFYRAVARRFAGDGPVLELACGSGRITVPLVRDGHRVIGLDVSAPMLAHARARLARLPAAARERARLVRADMRRFALARRFPLVVMGFNAFEHLYTRTDVAACLAAIRAHLAPDGRFVFDVQNPDLRWLARDPRRRWARTRFRHPTTGELVEYSTNHLYDPISQIAFIRFFYQTLDDDLGQRRLSVVRLAQRKFFPAELDALLWSGGFAVDERHGGFDGEPLADECEHQVLVCRPRI
jgi:SAM-dependent methyltransferase